MLTRNAIPQTDNRWIQGGTRPLKIKQTKGRQTHFGHDKAERKVHCWAWGEPLAASQLLLHTSRAQPQRRGVFCPIG